MSSDHHHRGALRVTVTCHTPRPVRVPGLASWLAGVAPGRARGEVSVALVTDARIRALNRRFRGVAHATDVLSFPSVEPAADTGVAASRVGARPKARAAREVAPLLGDVVIAIGVARRQARDAGHALGTEIRVLALHGLLHLAGYDHDTDGGAMARLESRLRRRGALREGLIERAGGARR